MTDGGMGMNETTLWQRKKFLESFEGELQGIRRRRAVDPTCAIADLEAILLSLYHIDGADYGGRGGVQDIALSASIAAYEQAIAEWKKESTPS